VRRTHESWSTQILLSALRRACTKGNSLRFGKPRCNTLAAVAFASPLKKAGGSMTPAGGCVLGCRTPPLRALPYPCSTSRRRGEADGPIVGVKPPTHNLTIARQLTTRQQRRDCPTTGWESSLLFWRRLLLLGGRLLWFAGAILPNIRRTAPIDRGF
jgi:hypothetical protein